MNDTIQWSPGVSLESVEKQAIILAYRFYRGNKTATANSLGIAIRTLDSKLEKYHADDLGEEKRYADDQARRKEWLSKMRGGPGYGDQNQHAPAEISPGIPSASEGVRMEPALDSPAQPSLPLSQREKVQSVLPKQTAKSDSRKTR